MRPYTVRASEMQHVGALMADPLCRLTRALFIGFFFVIQQFDAATLGIERRQA